MLENQRNGDISHDPSTIITPIPPHAEVVKNTPHPFTVKWEKGSPVYFLNEQDVTAQDFIAALNARLRFPLRTWVVFVFGTMLSAISAYNSEEMALIYFAGGFLLTCLVAWLIYVMSQSKRRVFIHFAPSDGTTQAVTKINDTLAKLSKFTRVWDYATGKTVTIQADAASKLTCNLPTTSFVCEGTAVIWLPDQLYILTGRRCQAYPYQELRVEGSTYRLEEKGQLPPDARLISQHWLHQRKDGQPDKRYRENYKISTVEYGLLHFRTLTDDLFQISISNSTVITALAAVFQSLAQQLSGKKKQNLSSPQSIPTAKPSVPPPSVPLQASAREVIYPLTSSQKEVIYPLTIRSEPREENTEHRSHQQFLQDAQTYFTRIGEPCQAVSLKIYSPTYASLYEAQKRWYFYWRTEARKGNFLPTDSSYLFLHSYEVLNLIEKKDPLEAAAYLRLLLQKYGHENKEIVRYFPEWSGDLVAEHIGAENALAFWGKQKFKTYFSDSLINSLVHQALRSNTLATIPWAIWYRLTDYRPNSKRFAGRISTEQLTEYNLRAVAIANVYWQKKTGKSIVEQFAPNGPKEIDKPLFKSAVMGRPHKPSISLGVAHDYVGNQRFRQHLAAVMKEGENSLLQQAGVAFRVAETDFPPELTQILRSQLLRSHNLTKQPSTHSPVMPPPRKPAPIKIDLARVAELQNESEKIRQLLGQKDQEPEPLSRPVPPVQPLPEKVAISRSEPVENQPPPAPTPLLEINLARVAELQEESDEISALLALDEEWQAPMTDAEASAIPPAASDAADEWRHFYTQLTIAEKELLKELFVADSLSEEQIRAIQRKHRVMSMIDGLCEKAFDVFSRDLLFNEDNHWVMEADDLEILRLKWKEMEQV
jgi:TerB N-terminal domain/TerB-C domain